jgi:hypothetical protein
MSYRPYETSEACCTTGVRSLCADNIHIAAAARYQQSGKLTAMAYAATHILFLAEYLRSRPSLLIAVV